jgi:hypothetical protein
MGFLDAIKRLFSSGSGSAPASASDAYGIWFHFRCKKCSSVVRVRADRRNDLNREDGPAALVLRKDVMDNKCFQLIRAELWLDDNYNVVTSEVEGGSLITQEEYEAAQTAQGGPTR